MRSYFTKQLFDGTTLHAGARLVVEGHTIKRVETTDVEQNNTDIYLDGLVTAGFIDTQVNGGGGSLLNSDTSVSALSNMVTGHCQFGTTSMLPTLITDSSTKMQSAALAVADAIEHHMPGVIGIHFEGPHLSVPKKGIHPQNHVRGISDADLALFLRKDIGKVMITVAPENVPTDIIKELVSAGVVVSLGHSGADIDCVINAIDAGATGFTHLFNAMSGLTAREPGLIAAALCDERVTSGLIADLHHVHGYNCQFAFRCIGADRLMLVTDAMAHVGSSVDRIPWLDTQIIRDDDKLTLEDGSLAGSCIDMAAAVRNMHQLLNNQLTAVLNMASRVPARFLGLDYLGELTGDKHANFILLNNKMHVQASWINGQQVAGEPLN